VIPTRWIELLVPKKDPRQNCAPVRADAAGPMDPPLATGKAFGWKVFGIDLATAFA